MSKIMVDNAPPLVHNNGHKGATDSPERKRRDMTETTHGTIEEATAAAVEEIENAPFDPISMDNARRIVRVEGGYRVESSVIDAVDYEAIVGYADRNGFESIESVRRANEEHDRIDAAEGVSEAMSWKRNAE